MAKSLTDTRIRGAKPRQKAYKLTDGEGLHLLVTPSGSRLWRFRFRQPGIAREERGRAESMVSLGAWPDVSLKEARERRDAQRKQLAAGVTPAAAKQAERLAQANTFEAVAREWLSKQRYAEKTLEKSEWIFDDLVYPFIGATPVNTLTPPIILELLRKIEKRGKHETAHRTRQRVSQVCRYAIATGRAESDPTRDLRGALTPIETTSHAAITEPAAVGDLLRKIDGYDGGQPTTRAALRLAPLVFLRPGELRAAEWSEFQLDGEEPTWRIPGPRMKMRDPHIVPLSAQAVAILRELHPLIGRGGLVFPSARNHQMPMSENTMNAALRRLGYTKTDMTPHGFRSMASTLLNEQGWHPDLIELQLAHRERNKVRAAYNRATRLAERRKMMQAWADYLDALKSGGRVGRES